MDFPGLLIIFIKNAQLRERPLKVKSETELDVCRTGGWEEASIRPSLYEIPFPFSIRNFKNEFG